MKPNAALEPFRPIVGTWKTTGRHPFLPGQEFHGETSFEFIENGAFLMTRSRLEGPGFPAGMAIIGTDDALGEAMMLYYDDRAVSRLYHISIEGRVLRWWRDDPKFSQRFTCTVSENGDSMEGRGEMSRDGGPWEDDLSLVYLRVATPAGR
jgi:hypothetical protein